MAVTSELLILPAREAALLKRATRRFADGRALDEAAVSDVSLTLFVNDDLGATNSWDDGVASKLDDVGGTGGSGGHTGSIVTSGADDDVAPVTEEESAATIVADVVVPPNLGDVVDVGGCRDSRRRRSSQCTAARPPGFCISVGKREKIRANSWRSPI